MFIQMKSNHGLAHLPYFAGAGIAAAATHLRRRAAKFRVAAMGSAPRRRSAIARRIRVPVPRLSVVAQCLALSVVLTFGNLPLLSHAQSTCPGIHVKILDIKNSTGTVACALFEAPEGFPTEFLRHATRIMMMKIQDTQGSCDFLDIEPGTYALAVIHDEDMDGKIDTNWMGVPTEGYGFSAEAEVSMSAPSFEDASFPYNGKDLELTISLNY